MFSKPRSTHIMYATIKSLENKPKCTLVQVICNSTISFNKAIFKGIRKMILITVILDGLGTFSQSKSKKIFFVGVRLVTYMVFTKISFIDYKL